MCGSEGLKDCPAACSLSNADDINMWPNAMLTFNHPLGVQIVWFGFLLSGFFKMLIKMCFFII